MEIGIYKGAASMAAYEKWQQAISENIANGSIPGYKKTDISFAAIESDLTGTQAGASADRVSGAMPSASPSITFSQGQLSHSDSELDFAIQGDGFFQVQQPNGAMAYTRNGQFHLAPDRTIVNAQGLPVQGEGGPITLKNTGGAVAINGDGVITQADQPIGKLPVYNFADASKLRRVGDGLVAPGDNTTTPDRIERPQVLNHYLEGSNVSPLHEMVNLVSVSRAYEASQKLIQTADDDSEKAIQTLGNPS